jgi:hypothetical protein
MTIRTLTSTLLCASTLALSGCFGPSNDKGDNGDPTIYTPKPSTVQDANTAGTSKTDLPVSAPGKPDASVAAPTEAAPK